MLAGRSGPRRACAGPVTAMVIKPKGWGSATLDGGGSKTPEACMRPHVPAPRRGMCGGRSTWQDLLQQSPSPHRRLHRVCGCPDLFHSPRQATDRGVRPATMVNSRLNVALVALLALLAGAHAAEMTFEATLDAAQQVGRPQGGEGSSGRVHVLLPRRNPKQRSSPCPARDHPAGTRRQAAAPRPPPTPAVPAAPAHTPLPAP